MQNRVSRKSTILPAKELSNTKKTTTLKLMGHKHSHHNNNSSSTMMMSEHEQDFHSNSSPNSARFNHSSTSSPRANNFTCNSHGQLDSCQTCKDSNTNCVKSKQERRFAQLLMLCQAFEEQYPECGNNL